MIFALLWSIKQKSDLLFSNDDISNWFFWYWFEAKIGFIICFYWFL